MFKSKKDKNDNNDSTRWSKLTDSFFSAFGRRKTVPVRNKKEILKISHKNPWLHLAVDIRAKNVASAELYVEEKRKVGKTYEIVELTEHPVLELLNNPNPLMMGFNFKYIMQAWTDLVGECLLLLDRDAKGEIIGLYPVSCDNIHKEPYAQNPYWQLTAGSEIISVYVTEAVYIKTPDLNNIYGRGVGKGQAINDEISIHELSGKQIGQYFYNSAIPPYLISLEGAGKEQAERVRDNWLNKNQGWVKRYLPHFLSGKVNAVKLQSDFKDMELNNLRKDQKENIMEFFQIPEELRGKNTGSNRATSENAETNFAKQVVVPALNFILMYVNDHIMPEFQTQKNAIQRVKYRNVVPRDKAFERDTKKGIPWAFSINEHRRVAGEIDVKGFDDVYPVPLGIQLTKFDNLTTEQQEAVKSFKKQAITKNDDVRLSELTRIINSVDYDDLNEDVVEEYIKLVAKTGTSTLIDLGELNENEVWEITNPKVLEDLENLSLERINLIDETLKKNLRNELVIGYNEGESIQQIITRLNKNVFDGYKKGYELERIARTETMTTVNYGTLKAYEEAEVPNKEWIATTDDRTRDNHLLMDGQTVGTKEEFESPEGDRTLAPGQFGLADEDINCRCTIGAKFDEKSQKDRIEYRKKQDKKAVDAESDFEDVYSERFAKVQKIINKALRGFE